MMMVCVGLSRSAFSATRCPYIIHAQSQSSQMSALEGRAEALAGTFNAQDAANTLCRGGDDECA
jgi:hypothetical protein